LPPNYGTSGQILQTDGTGVMTWVTNTGGSGISEELAIAYAVVL